MELFRISDFKGISDDEKLWSQGYSRYCYGMDVAGFTQFVEGEFRPVSGGFQAFHTTSADGATGEGLIKAFAYYSPDTAQEQWGITESATAPYLYQRTSASGWAVQRTSADGLGALNVDQAFLEEYNGRLLIPTSD